MASHKQLGIAAVGLCLWAGGGTDSVAQTVIFDELIVQQSACIGSGCQNGEVFGFDTVRIAGPDTRIEFVDTSTTAGFPSNDWEIVINDSTVGGSSYFAIRDVTANQTLFRVCAVADVTCTNIVPINGAPGFAGAVITSNQQRIGALESRVGGLETRVDALERRVDVNRDGVAIAIALGGATALRADQTYTLGVGYGSFDGAGALGVNGGVRLNDIAVANGAIGFGAATGVVGGRAGLQLAW